MWLVRTQLRENKAAEKLERPKSLMENRLFDCGEGREGQRDGC